MSRPEPTVILEQELGTGHIWQVLAAEATYIITYKNQPCGIRVIPPSIDNSTFKYKKMTYTNLGNAMAQVRLLNHRFNCQDFSVLEVYT